MVMMMMIMMMVVVKERLRLCGHVMHSHRCFFYLINKLALFCVSSCSLQRSHLYKHLLVMYPMPTRRALACGRAALREDEYRVYRTSVEPVFTDQNGSWCSCRAAERWRAQTMAHKRCYLRCSLPAVASLGVSCVFTAASSPRRMEDAAFAAMTVGCGEEAPLSLSSSTQTWPSTGLLPRSTVFDLVASLL